MIRVSISAGIESVFKTYLAICEPTWLSCLVLDDGSPQLGLPSLALALPSRRDVVALPRNWITVPSRDFSRTTTVWSAFACLLFHFHKN